MTGFVGIRELSNNMKKTLYRLKKDGSLIITEHGDPIAFMLPIGDDEYAFDRAYQFIKDYEFKSSLDAIVDSNKDNPNRNMTMDQINEVIAEVRKEMRKKINKKSEKK